MAFILMEEVQSILLVVPWGPGEKVARDFFRVEPVEEAGISKLTEGLEEAVVLTDGEEEVEAAEATLGEVVEIMKMTPVEGEEDRTTQEKISEMTVATIQLDMVR